MKSAELKNYIRERLGDQIHRFDLYRDMTQLMLRYRWIGDKLFDMDPERPLILSEVFIEGNIKSIFPNALESYIPNYIISYLLKFVKYQYDIVYG